MEKYSNLMKNIIVYANLIRVQKDLDILKQNIGNYIHFSDSERFGISYHKNVAPGNPRGLYGFPLTNEKLNAIINKSNLGSWEQFAYGKHIYIFSVNGNILNLEDYNFDQIAKNILSLLKSKYNFSDQEIYWAKYMDLSTAIEKRSFFDLIWRLFEILRNKKLVSNEHSYLNTILRLLGFDAIETNANGFNDDMVAEICVVNPLSINLITKIDNPVLKLKNS